MCILSGISEALMVETVFTEKIEFHLNPGWNWLLEKTSSAVKCVHIYIYIYIHTHTLYSTELFRPIGPHQCSADEQDGEAYII